MSAIEPRLGEGEGFLRDSTLTPSSDEVESKESLKPAASLTPHPLLGIACLMVKPRQHRPTAAARFPSGIAKQ